MTNHPTQPLELDEHGVMRFKQNSIVRMLLDSHPSQDLRSIKVFGNFPPEDCKQLMQLIGYSVSGYGDLDIAPDEEIEQLDELTAKMLNFHNLPEQEWIDCGACYP